MEKFNKKVALGKKNHKNTKKIKLFYVETRIFNRSRNSSTQRSARVHAAVRRGRVMRAAVLAVRLFTAIAA